jgi:putative oxidoreductase
MKILTATNMKIASVAILLLRFAVGVIFFAGGAAKMLGWFADFGPEVTVGFYKMMGFSKFWAYLSSYTELIGGLLLVVGFLTRIAAFALFINMIVAFIVSLPGGFIAEHGSSTPFAFMICVLAILVSGPMMFSIDWRAFGTKKTPAELS